MTKFSPAYRRAAYFLVAAILAVLAATGLITEAQYDSWTGIVEDLLPILGTGALLVAGAKTHEGSDDKTTREDVNAAYQAAQPVYIEPEPNERPLLVTVAEARADAEAAREAAIAALKSDLQDEARAAYLDLTRRE